MRFLGLFILLLHFCPSTCLTEEESADLTTLAKSLYEVEDKLDHLLYHFNHDVTRRSYRRTRFGTITASAPKNPNSIHQKLKMLDTLNASMGPHTNWKVAAANAYNAALGGPALAMPGQYGR